MAHLRREQHPNARVTTATAEAIRNEYHPGQISMKTLGRRYGVSEATISRIINGITWTAEDQHSETSN